MWTGAHLWMSETKGIHTLHCELAGFVKFSILKVADRFRFNEFFLFLFVLNIFKNMHFSLLLLDHVKVTLFLTIFFIFHCCINFLYLFAWIHDLAKDYHSA